ncbi:hypothetical protein R3P38DRAFT_2824103 [Favolaschia claudopus]|uniref:Uncharacterized protein n=1 Tax=Favolaschia claudopus TaxID=2862362 RepID=A0AAW0EG29_9AGAR
MKRLNKDVRKIEAATNKHNVEAFNHILDVAYGRKGKLKQELMEPLLSEPREPLPPRIIASVAKSQPPVYSLELRALLASAASRSTGKGVTQQVLDSPPKLPPRADPKSEQARSLGPFSKRREKNIRWRFFVEQSNYVWPPLQSEVDNSSAASYGEQHCTTIRALPMQGLRVFEDLETLASPPSGRTFHSTDRLQSAGFTVPRWLRRRYQALLTRIPTLTYKVQPNNTTRCVVSQSTKAMGRKPVDVDVSDVEWLTESSSSAQKATNPRSIPNQRHVQQQ